MKKPKKSPLKDRPLRSPGQSLDDEIQKILNEEVDSYLLAPLVMILFAVGNWLLWYQVIKLPSPYLMTISAIGVSIYSFLKSLR